MSKRVTESDRSGREDADDDRRAGRGETKVGDRVWASKLDRTVAGVARGEGGGRKGEGGRRRGRRGRGRGSGGAGLRCTEKGGSEGWVWKKWEEKKRSTRLKVASDDSVSLNYSILALAPYGRHGTCTGPSSYIA